MHDEAPTMFFFFFSLSSTLKNMLPLQKNKIVCYLLILSYLNLILLIVLNLIYFIFQFHPLTFDFYIKIVLLFYDIFRFDPQYFDF